jgi:hypothetical protein
MIIIIVIVIEWYIIFRPRRNTSQLVNFSLIKIKLIN